MTQEQDTLSFIRTLTGRTQRDGPPDPARIAAFLRQQGDLGGELLDARCDPGRRKSGASSGTQIVDAVVRGEGGREAVRKLVFRYDLGGAFFLQYDLPAQFKLMRAVRDAGFPCPEALWLDAAGEICGAPGLFMAFIDAPAPAGQPFAEGPLAEAGEADRREMILAAVRSLARLHRLSPAIPELAFLAARGQGAHFIDRELDWTGRELLHALPDGFGGARRGFYDHVRSVLLKVRDQLARTAPRERPPELAHGDANLSNFMFEGTNVAALLDWELCHFGLGEADLGYCIAGIAHFLHLLAPMHGVPTAEEMAAVYRDERGELKDWDYCQLFGQWRLTVFQAMAFSRLPPSMADLEESYWAQSLARLSQFVDL